MREQQFDEMVKRSLTVSRDLEQEQTRRYLEEDMLESESRYSQYKRSGSSTTFRYRTVTDKHYQSRWKQTKIEEFIQNRSTVDRIDGGVFLSRHGMNTIPRRRSTCNILRRYLYEQALMNEVILKLLYRASNDPFEERINFYDLDKYPG